MWLPALGFWIMQAMPGQTSLLSLPVGCMQAGNTGLAGGSVPVFDEVILQTGGMDQIHSFDEVRMGSEIASLSVLLVP